MGVDYHFHICRKVDNSWKELVLYRKHIVKSWEKEEKVKNKMDPVYLDYGRDHELYEKLHNCYGVHRFNIDSLVEGDFKDELKEDFKENEYTGFYNLECINFADIIIDSLTHPVVEDFDNCIEDTKTPSLKENPLKSLVKDIWNYIHFCEDYLASDSPTDYLFVMYCDN